MSRAEMKALRLPALDSPAASILIGAGTGMAALVFVQASFNAGFDPGSAAFTLASAAEWGSLRDPFLNPVPGFPSSPLALVSLRADRILSPSIPLFTALLNLLIHSLNCALLHRLVLRQQPRNPVAAAAAAAFMAASPAALPYMFMANQRAPLLALSFLLGTLLLASPNIDRVLGPGRLILSYIAYAASVCSCAWALLALPVVLLRSGGQTGSSVLRRLPYPLIAAAWLWAVLPDGAHSSTVQQPSCWTPMSLVLALVPFAGDLPRGDLQLFLTIAMLVLLGLAMPRIHKSMPSMIRGVVWFVPSMLAARAEYPDPVGLNLQSAYVFLPGVALILGLAVSHAIERASRDLRSLAQILFLTTLVVFLNLDSIYAVRVVFRTGRVYERLDRLVQAAEQSKIDDSLLLIQGLVSDSIPYTDDCNPYLDLIHRCRTGKPMQRLWLMASHQGSWLWNNPPIARGLRLGEESRTGLILAAASDVSDLVGQDHVAVMAMTDQEVFSVDTHLPASRVAKLSHRFPLWTTDLSEWVASDATLESNAGSARVESGARDPSLVSPAFSWPSYLVGRIQIELKLIKQGESDSLRFYWECGFAPGFSEERAMSVTIPSKQGDDPRVEIEVPLSDDLRWIASGRLSRIRLDPPRGSIIEIGAVRLAPPGDWGGASEREGPSEWRGLALEEFQGGSIDRVDNTDCYRTTTEDPWISIGASIDPGHYDLLRVTMRCRAEEATGESRLLGKVYWRSAGQPRYAEDRALQFPIGSDGEVRTYVIGLSRHFDWIAGEQVEGIRLDPFPGMGEFCLLAVELGSSRQGKSLAQ